MQLSLRNAIEAGLLSLVLGACATTDTVSGGSNPSPESTRGAPIQTDDVRCDPQSNSMPSDCQFIGSGQMTPGNRK